MAAQTPKKKASGCGTLIVFAAIVIAAIAIASHHGSKTPTPASASQPFRATNAQMASAVTTAVDADGDAANVNGTPEAFCDHIPTGVECTVFYTVKEPGGFSAALELIDPTRGFFKTAFTDPSMQRVTAHVSGPVTSVGGKSLTGRLFILSCTRAAANQIDWDNVGVNGLKTLCSFTPEAQGLNN